MLFEAIECFSKAYNMFNLIFGSDSIPVASCHSAMAVVYFHMDELKLALEQQEKAHSILSNIEKK